MYAVTSGRFEPVDLTHRSQCTEHDTPAHRWKASDLCALEKVLYKLKNTKHQVPLRV